MEVDDGLNFLGREVSTLDVGPEIVAPPESATLPAPIKPGSPRERLPTAMPMFINVIFQLLIFFWCPWPFL